MNTRYILSRFSLEHEKSWDSDSPFKANCELKREGGRTLSFTLSVGETEEIATAITQLLHKQSAEVAKELGRSEFTAPTIPLLENQG